MLAPLHINALLIPIDAAPAPIKLINSIAWNLSKIVLKSVYDTGPETN